MELLQIGHDRPEPSLPVVEEGALSVTLVCMPWAPVDMPSLAISTIAPLFAGRGEVGRLDALYANIRWLLAQLVDKAGGGAEHLAEIVESRADVVGLTTTLDQNIASFALARRVKELSPTTVTVLGGANCDGVQGTAIHQARTEIDYVVRGEAEHSIGPLVAHSATSRSGRTDPQDEAARDGRLEALVEEWTTLGLTFREGSTYLALATGPRW